MDAHSCFIVLLTGMTGWLPVFCGILFLQGYITPSALKGKLFVCNGLKHTENIPFQRDGRQCFFLLGNGCAAHLLKMCSNPFLRHQTDTFDLCPLMFLLMTQRKFKRTNTPGHKVLLCLCQSSTPSATTREGACRALKSPYTCSSQEKHPVPLPSNISPKATRSLCVCVNALKYRLILGKMPLNFSCLWFGSGSIPIKKLIFMVAVQFGNDSGCVICQWSWNWNYIWINTKSVARAVQQEPREQGNVPLVIKGPHWVAKRHQPTRCVCSGEAHIYTRHTYSH